MTSDQNERIVTALENIARHLSEISDGLKHQNEMLSDVVSYPDGEKQPPRIVVGCCGPMEVITF